jgi:hypothetical protein
MPELTVEQFVGKLDRWVSDLKESEEPMIIAVKDTVGMMAVRIFEKGLDSNNSPIGQYDTVRELWVDDINLPKAGNHTGKTGNPIKTSYYENYKQLREQQGRESGFVNLRLTGRLQSEVINKPLSETVTEPGEPDKVGELEFVVSVSTQAKKKIDGNEKRFGKKIFNLTKDEEEHLATVFLFEWLDRFQTV